MLRLRPCREGQARGGVAGGAPPERDHEREMEEGRARVRLGRPSSASASRARTARSRHGERCCRRRAGRVRRRRGEEQAKRVSGEILVFGRLPGGATACPSSGSASQSASSTTPELRGAGGGPRAHPSVPSSRGSRPRRGDAVSEEVSCERPLLLLPGVFVAGLRHRQEDALKARTLEVE